VQATSCFLPPKRQLILWHPEAVNGLDPETGKVFWTHRHAPSVRAGMTIPTPRTVGDAAPSKGYGFTTKGGDCMVLRILRALRARSATFCSSRPITITPSCCGFGKPPRLRQVYVTHVRDACGFQSAIRNSKSPRSPVPLSALRSRSEPDNRDPGRPVVWSHPAFANRCVDARNDHEIVWFVVSGGVKSVAARRCPASRVGAEGIEVRSW
jgi:hypothetical protein